jgi:hypothetical protein
MLLFILTKNREKKIKYIQENTYKASLKGLSKFIRERPERQVRVNRPKYPK